MRINTILKKLDEILNFLKTLQSSSKFEKELQELQLQNEKIRKEMQILQAKIREKEKINNRLEIEKQELEKEKSELQEKLKDNQILNRLEYLYLSLSDKTRENIQNILNGNDKFSIYTSGILNIEKIWDYAQYLRNEHKDEEFEIMRDIFYLLFEVYAPASRLKFQDVNIGDKFDMDYFIRDNRSESQAGIVDEVILRGIVRHGKIIKKSIVKVK